MQYQQFNNIQQLVDYLKKQYNITVLSLRDHGSRSWNLNSESSDMDIAIVFSQPSIDYIKVNQYIDNIHRKVIIGDEEVDLSGWNIKRFAELLKESNPVVVEWLNSNVIYYEIYPFFELQDHANQNFKPISLIYHYRSMAKKNYQKQIQNNKEPTVKRYIYTLRGLLYSRYVEVMHKIPPLDFIKFLDIMKKALHGLPERIAYITQEAYRLALEKKQGNGNQLVDDKELLKAIEEEFQHSLDNKQHITQGISLETINDSIEKLFR